MTDISRDHTDRSQSVHGPGAVVNHVESSKLLPWLMVLCILSALAFAFSLFASASAWWQAKEAKQVQVQLMYTNAILLREGLVRQGDMVYGPEGNLEYDGKWVRPEKEK